jgi:hypothetical protein
MEKVKTSELDWFKFFNDPENPVEYRKEDVPVNNGRTERQVIVWLYPNDIERFVSEIGNIYRDYNEDGGFDVKWQGDCIAVDFSPILDYYGLDADRIFPQSDASR